MWAMQISKEGSKGGQRGGCRRNSGKVDAEEKGSFEGLAMADA